MDLLDAPEHVAEREGIHERIQSEMRNEEKEKVSWAEEMLELPMGWNEVIDLIMDDSDTLPKDLRLEKQKRDEVARRWRKCRNEEDIRADKRVHSQMESHRIHPPPGFYAEVWMEDQQEEDDYLIPDKLQRISRMVFHNGVSEVPPIKHQGGGCSVFNLYEHVFNSAEDKNQHLSES